MSGTSASGAGSAPRCFDCFTCRWNLQLCAATSAWHALFCAAPLSLDTSWCTHMCCRDASTHTVGR